MRTRIAATAAAVAAALTGAGCATTLGPPTTPEAAAPSVSVVPLPSGRPLDATVWSLAGFPVDGLLTAAQVQELPAGTPICTQISVTQIDCGPLIATTEDGLRYAGAAGAHDGAAVFLVTQTTHRATVIGMYRGDDHGEATASYIERDLASVGGRLITAPPDVKGPGK